MDTIQRRVKEEQVHVLALIQLCEERKGIKGRRWLFNDSKQRPLSDEWTYSIGHVDVPSDRKRRIASDLDYPRLDGIVSRMRRECCCRKGSDGECGQCSEGHLRRKSRIDLFQT